MSRSWMDPRIATGRSDIHGRGLRAREPIAAGEVVVHWKGEIWPKERLGELKARPRYDCAAISEHHIVVFEPDDPVVRGNHSCEPNLWMESATSISTRLAIAAGEELTIDYALHSDDPGWSLICRCGSAACRGTITGLDWQLSELQRRYEGHFEPYLAERYQALERFRSHHDE